MKYQCNNPTCKKQFLHVAKETTTKTNACTDNDSFSERIVESSVCPFCSSLDFTEAPDEPKINAEIVALIDSPLADVNARLAEGYQVMPDKIYAKNAILVKYRKTEVAQ